MDYLNEFRAHMATFGLEPGEIIADEKIHRFGKNKNGWYVMFLGADGAGGAFGDWSLVDTERWSSFANGTVDPERMARFEAQMKEQQKLAAEETKAKHEKGALSALEIWEQGQPAPENHPYLQRKKAAVNGLKVEKGTTTLLVPMYAAGIKLVGLQRIFETGVKKFLYGSEIVGSCSIIKGRFNDRVYVCEGYSTAATIHEATNRTVFMAFNAGNMHAVCKNIRSKTDVPIIVCADEDDSKYKAGCIPYNAGRIAAGKCQRDFGCIVIFPVFADTSTKPTDFNDLMCLEGIGRVKAIASDPWDSRTTQVYKRVKEWASESKGKFTTVEIDRELGLETIEDRQARESALNELIRSGILEHDDVKRGTYRARDCEIRVMDLTGSKVDETFELCLPFDMHDSVKLSPRNIIMIAGEANAGKTSMAIEMLRENIEIYGGTDTKIFYLSSEMSDAEMSNTLKRFGDIKMFMDNCTFIDKQFEPYDAIKADPEMQNGIVFIDFLETRGGDYSKTVSEVQKIYEAMGNGVVILLVQKQPGKDHAKGGSGMLEKPRFAINLEKRFKSQSGTVCVASIAKCKAVHQGHINPDGQSVHYLVNENGIKKIASWGYPTDKQKDSTDDYLKENLGVSEYSAPVIDHDALNEVRR